MAKKMEFKCIKANIADEDGNKVLVGQTVSFGKKYAEHYRKLGYIEMPLPDFGEEEEAEVLSATADDIAEEAKDEFVPVDRGGNPLEEKSSPKPAAKRRRL